MQNQIVIKSPDGTFRAHISRPAKLPAPTIVVLQELFGVNADIRATCDELAAQGFIAIAPDLFWRQEPGVDLDVRSEADWQHGLRLYAAYDRDAGAKDIKETVRTAVELPESTGKVALQGYCLGALMAFITAARYQVNAAVAYHGGDTEKYLGEVGGLNAPLLMHLGEEDEFISKTAQAEINAALAKNRTRLFTVIPVSVTPSLGIMARITTPPRQRSQIRGPANFCINNCGELRPLEQTPRKPSFFFIFAGSVSAVESPACRRRHGRWKRQRWLAKPNKAAGRYRCVSEEPASAPH
jgi:carboxymethylenebutenolidase